MLRRRAFRRIAENFTVNEQTAPWCPTSELGCGVLNEKVAREPRATTGLVQTANAREYVRHDQSSKRSTIEQR